MQEIKGCNRRQEGNILTNFCTQYEIRINFVQLNKSRQVKSTNGSQFMVGFRVNEMNRRSNHIFLRELGLIIWLRQNVLKFCRGQFNLCNVLRYKIELFKSNKMINLFRIQSNSLIKITDYNKPTRIKNIYNQPTHTHSKSILLHIMISFKRLSIVTTILLLFLVSSYTQICSPSLYFNGQRCAPCKPNCKCYSDNTCDTCLSGYAFDSRFENCLQCPLAAGSVNVGCKECCSQISGTAFVCSECIASSYVFLKGGQCIRSQGCLSLADTGVCTSCENGYYLLQGICSPCHASCKTCRDSTLCTSCNSGYFNSTNTHFSYCTTCSLGCKSCTSATACQACSQGYLLSGGACTPCAANCLTCTATACTQCNTASILISGICYLCTDSSKSGTLGCTQCTTQANKIFCTKTALSFYLNNNGQSIACSTTFSNSLQCTSTTIKQCQNDYNIILTNRYHLIGNQCIANIKSCKLMATSAGDCSECYFQGPNSYYKLVNGECVKCDQLGCKAYSTTCQCMECQDGYRYVNNLCVACQNLHCIKCQVDVQSCEKCAAYYGLFSSACIRCAKSNCLNCDGDYTLCKLCQNGYYLSSGSCYLCQANCLLCQSNTKCTQCAPGTYLQANGRCKVKPSHCLQVDSKYLAENVAVCKKCEYGYQVVEGNCYPCSQALYNLNTCEKYCPSYYALKSYGGWVVYSLMTLALVVVLMVLQ